jgi:hypothetical protein
MLRASRITKLPDNMINNFADEGITCENSEHPCRELPEYRCELGPLDPRKQSGNGGAPKLSVNLCPIHTKEFAKANHLELPATRTVSFWNLFRKS